MLIVVVNSMFSSIIDCSIVWDGVWLCMRWLIWIMNIMFRFLMRMNLIVISLKLMLYLLIVCMLQWVISEQMVVFVRKVSVLSVVEGRKMCSSCCCVGYFMLGCGSVICLWCSCGWM